MLFMKKIFFISFACIVIISSFCFYIYHSASKPITEAEQQAIEIAKEHVKINNIIETSFFNGDEPYHVIRATNEHDQEIIIWVSEANSDKIIVEFAKNGLTKEQVKEYALSELDIKELQDIRIGMKYNIPVWEITFIDSNDRYSFYYLTFNGETWIENYRLKAIS